MGRVAVLTALSAVLLVVSGRPRILEDQSFGNAKDKGFDDVPTELYSLNSPHSEQEIGYGEVFGPHNTESRMLTVVHACIQLLKLIPPTVAGLF